MIILKLKSMFFVVGALAVTAQMDCYGADAAGDGAAQIGVVFPGPQPGKAQALQAEGSIWTLENQVILATWANEGGTLRPVRLMNKLTGTELNQRGAELFRLAAAMPEKTGLEKPGFVVAVRLDAN
ncbi:MAG: hypothetical protein NTX50_26125, partial [Candidatus Sumerlaeota bacterium]|nr:hypothetical protein [Candidatus Sumerlaeota bacterium]